MPRAITVADPVDLYVGAQLKARRLEAGMSQAELATRIGVTFQQVQKYERGANRMSASMLMRAAGVVGVTVVSFFPGPEDRESDPSSDIRTVSGGAELASRYLEMAPNQRALLLEIADQFVRPTPAGRSVKST